MVNDGLDIAASKRLKQLLDAGNVLLFAHGLPPAAAPRRALGLRKFRRGRINRATNKYISYFQELDAWLTAVLIATEDDHSEEEWFARVKKQIKDKILESYRIGQKAGLEPEKTLPVKEKLPRETRPRKFWPPQR